MCVINRGEIWMVGHPDTSNGGRVGQPLGHSL